MRTDTVDRLEPRSPQEAATLMREAADAHARLAFMGGGTHGAIGAQGVDAVLTTRGLRRIVEYAPEDQTVTVEAGLPIAELSRELASHGQRIVVEVAEPELATVGGAIAANAFGPRRMSYGSLKDLILGASMVRADGTPARAGGKVVKNVAGFDVAKLIVGSYGTLALVTATTLRVHPLPEAARAFRMGGMTAECVWSLVLAVRARQLEPAAILAMRTADGEGSYDVDVVLEGFEAGVAAKVSALHALAVEHQWKVVEVPATATQDADAAIRRSGPLRLRSTALPSEFAILHERVITPVLWTLDAPAAVAYPALGVAFFAGAPRDLTAMQAALTASRQEAERRGGSLVVEAMPSEANGAPIPFDRWGTPPPSFPLMQQLKARFDPHRRLNPGSFIGGL